MNLFELQQFLNHTMQMTDVYQPVVIKALLLNNGQSSKDALAAALADYDIAVRDYYHKVLMRWPKITHTKHSVIKYENNGKQFILNCNLDDEDQRLKTVALCDAKIEEWIERTKTREKDPVANASVRYRVLKNAGGKCELCGIPSSLRPIDIDHVIPQSKADKFRKVVLHGKHINVNAEENLQALCDKCNRAKRDADDTDFRRLETLLRDKEPQLMRDDGHKPRVEQLRGARLKEALAEKLVEGHENYLNKKELDELADMTEVILALAGTLGLTQTEFLDHVNTQRITRGGFTQGYLYSGDEPVAASLAA